VFRIILGVNSDYFLKHRQPADLCNGEELCFLCGTDWIIKCYLDELRASVANASKRQACLYTAAQQGLTCYHRRKTFQLDGSPSALLNGVHKGSIPISASNAEVFGSETEYLEDMSAFPQSLLQNS
jgi:hypothetical protein